MLVSPSLLIIGGWGNGFYYALKIAQLGLDWGNKRERGGERRERRGRGGVRRCGRP
jgi:hypothetical protein